MLTCPVLSHTDIPMAADRGAGWKKVRDTGPGVLVDGNLWFTRADDVRFILRNPQIFSSKAAFDMLGSPVPLVPIAFDAPEHARYRRILQPPVSPVAMEEMLPALQTQIDALMDSIIAKGSCDIFPDLAIPYPSGVFLTLAGLPHEDLDRFLPWKDAVINLGAPRAPDSPEPDLTPALELFGYLSEYITKKRQQPGPDLLSRAMAGDDPLSDEELIGMAFLFVLAGLDTVTSVIGSAFRILAQRPDLQQALTEDPKARTAFVEEVVRLEPPAPVVPRVATEDVEVGGLQIPAGTMVFASVGSASRDELGDELDLAKGDGRHLGFGGGPHRCLGSHLARLELKLVMTEWHKRIPSYRLDGDPDLSNVWPAATFGMHSLPLTWD